jgi:hypothetical protein
LLLDLVVDEQDASPLCASESCALVSLQPGNRTPS